MTGVSYEPWHFRYVGVPHAYLIQNQNMCFEEYIDYLKQFEFDKQHLEVDFQGQNYEIYYVKANENQLTQVPVPKGRDYSISGNNVDGFIITAEL